MFELKERLARGARDSVESGGSIVDVIEGSGLRCRIVLPDGTDRTVGQGPPTFTVTFRDESALAIEATEWGLGTAYIDGLIDIDGSMLDAVAIRDHLRPGASWRQSATFAYDLFIRNPISVNKESIDKHYTLGDDFYLTFIDERYRFYSHCLFESEDETLEEAAEHKLESMWNALGLQPGMRLLDIGGGWGGVAEYCSARGVEVTSVTVVEDSARFIAGVIAEKGLDAHVVHSDFLEFEADEPFDHVVIYGVIEHIPNYARFSAKVWDSLKEGGRLYLDASATVRKFDISPITRQYTWPGHHSFFSLADMLHEQLVHGFEVREVKRETRDYELTITRWAERFEEAKDQIIVGWGEDVYRAFRIFLWGGSHAFATNRLQAYHMVTQKLSDQGPRPGLGGRLLGFARGAVG